MRELLRDLRFSFRLLLKSPVFTLAAVGTLALGIGLNAATFSAVRGILFRPLGGAESPDRLVQVYRHWSGLEYGSNSIPHYQDLRDRTGDVFSNLAAWTFAETALAADGQPERLIGAMVSANFFQTYGTTMRLGRPFLPGEEDRGPGAHPVVVLGHSFWQNRFGGDREVVGKAIDINGHRFEIVGVAGRGFRGPSTFADIPFYAPLMMEAELNPGSRALEARGSNSYNVVGRLRDGVTVERAADRLEAVLAQLREELPGSYEDQVGHTLVLQNESGFHPTLRDAQFGMSAVISVVVAMLLLIVCLNVANLFLARAQDRRREMGVRMSLGASRWDVVRQLLTESLVFSLLGGLAGLALAWGALHLLAGIRPPMDGPWHFDLAMDHVVLGVTFAVAVAAGLVFGLAPALQAARPDTVAAVKSDSERSGRSRASRALVVVQMAMSLVLLISSGLFLRALQKAALIDPGVDSPAHLVTLSMDPGMRGYDEARTRDFYDRLLAELNARPDIEEAGLIAALPLGLNSSDQGVDIPSYEFSEGESQTVMYTRVSEGYLEAAGIRMVEGRTFDERDDETGAPVIIVNERFRDRFWPGQSALGKVVRTGGTDRTVIGVTETGKYRSLGEAATEYMYLPYRELFRSSMSVVARTPGNPAARLADIREIVRRMDPDLPVYDTRTVEDHMGIALMPARLGASVLGIFGLLGLVLAAVGIYGVMAYSVSRRRREIGIRMALGARRGRVISMVLKDGLRLAIIGAVIGFAAAVGASRLVRGMLYGSSALDPVAFVGVPLLLIGVAALAVLIPARRAASFEPVRTLRAD